MSEKRRCTSLSAIQGKLRRKTFGIEEKLDVISFLEIGEQIVGMRRGVRFSVSSVYTVREDGFGGLVVNMLASGSRVRGFELDRSRWIFFRCEKILSMPSFGGEVK
jgi:hypothetical protein